MFGIDGITDISNVDEREESKEISCAWKQNVAGSFQQTLIVSGILV
jgi:hypothetical protein